MTQLRALILACLLLSGSYGWAQESGGIKGVVQLEGKGVAQHRIMLLQFGAGPQPSRTPGQTDADGRFTFEGLKTGAELNYVVGIRYEGVLYKSDPPIQLKPGETRDDIVVKVGEGGRKALEGDGPAMPTGVHIGHQIIAVVWREDHLEVREIVGIRHTGSEAYRGPGGPDGVSPYVLHLPLPDGHYNLQDVQGLEKTDHIRSDALGLYYTAPLEPGTYRVIYTYSLPMPSSVTTILARRTLPLVVLDLFVEAEHLVASSDLQVMGQVPIESRLFLHFRGANLAPQSRTWFQITLARRGTSTAVRILGYGLIIGLTLCALLIPAYSVLRGKSQPQSISAEPVRPTQVQKWRAERQRLVQQIARLDDEREAGELAAPAYREQRRMYKQQLLEVAQQLQTVQGTAEASGVLSREELG